MARRSAPPEPDPELEQSDDAAAAVANAVTRAVLVRRLGERELEMVDLEARAVMAERQAAALAGLLDGGGQ